MQKVSQGTLKWLRIFWRAAKHFYDEDYTYHCSALGFITILAIVPVFSVLIYAVNKFSDLSNVYTLLNNYLYANFLPASVQVIQQYVEQFSNQASKLPTMSIIFSLVTGIMLLLVIEQTLNQIWRVHHKQRHLVTRVISLMILMLLPMFIGFSSFLSEFIYTKIEVSYIQYIAVILFNLIINTSIFAIFYIVVPNKIIDWRDGFIGGLITAMLFEVTKKLFVLYVAYFSNFTAVYGTLAIIPIFLTWLYVSWIIFLYGALCIQVKSAIEHKYEK